MVRTLLLTAAIGLGLVARSFAFCGFYVAKADASLFNNKSEVIIARHNGQTVITMSSDFQGDVKDFAMVVPVPVVLQRDQIRLAEQALFSRLDAYSGPRIVEYYDESPCYDKLEEEYMLDDVAVGSVTATEAPRQSKRDKDLGVTIVESYSVGEYDILILSAEESDGLQTWLTENGYKVPEKAAGVLAPYIKSDMKFFVVKVNLDRNPRLKANNLRPIQMTFRSQKFGLPIRLGMANAQGDQDMIVYAFSSEGRIETTNYRTLELPSDKDIPLFVQQDFGDFYTQTFAQSYRQNPKAVWVEYAWDLDGSNFVKCDPCPVQPPAYADLREAGVFWAKGPGNGYAYQGKVFMTRLHVRYNRQNFPQDLQFNVTPNRRNFQLRYVTHHPATGSLDCEEAQPYLKKLRRRRQQEVANLVALTGQDPQQRAFSKYIHAYDQQIDENAYFGPLDDEDDGIFWLILFGGLGLGWYFLLVWVSRRYLRLAVG